jgi:hypothetical protein
MRNTPGNDNSNVFNIPLNIPQRSVIGLFNELDTEANYAGNALVEYFVLKLIHKHYKRIACVSNFRVLFDMIDMSTTVNQYVIHDYDFKEAKLELLKEAIHSCKNNMFVLYISIVFNHHTRPIAHSVIAIINKRLNTLEYYNPHGFTPFDYNKVLENIIVQEKLEKLTMDLGLSLSMNAMHCPLQNRITDPGITEDKGYCTIFASIFVLFRLANYRMSLARFSAEFLNYTFDMDTNDYARHFSFYILKEVRKFAKNFGIESTHIHDIFLEFIKSHSLNDIVKSINQTGGNPLALLRAAKMAPKLKNVKNSSKNSGSGDDGSGSKTSQFLTGVKDGVETMSKISEQSKKNKNKNKEESKKNKKNAKTKLQRKTDKVKGWFS